MNQGLIAGESLRRSGERPAWEMQGTAPQDAARINFLWLLRLRWGAMAGQTITILGVQWLLAMTLPLRLLLAIIACEAVSNGACALWVAQDKRVEPWMLGALMAADVLLLSGLLYLTGGAFNPFSFLYLVHIALAAVVLSPGWTWTLVGLSLACFGSLFLLPQPSSIAGMDMHLEHAHMHMHLQGMWVAFAVAAAFIVYFVQRVRAALTEREQQLAEARDRTARSEKLASLATLAAGAAHELSTPLSTIAVVAKELEHQIERRGGADDAVADARLIREQVSRCRAILVQMTADAGESMGESSQAVSIDSLLEQALDGLQQKASIRILDGDARSFMVEVPRNPVAHAIRNVLKNALEASAGAGDVQVRMTAHADDCCLEVTDRGIGMPPDVLDRAGEPFFTTKAPGQGMGLGLFLSRVVFARLGGRLEIESAPGHGTTVRLYLPGKKSPSGGDRARGGVDQAA
jgi:two-component system sensor histidine kinase RegB